MVVYHTLNAVHVTNDNFHSCGKFHQVAPFP
ncbi:hypothetical protein M2321_002859 [Rhodoblastus acidophilus]|nr:hypothetical protein [Rhodoblastus acidophilus]